MNRVLQTFAAFVTLLTGTVTPSLAERLPIQIVVSFDYYELIDDFPNGREALREKLLPDLSRYVLQKLSDTWVAAEQDVENKLIFAIEGSAFDGTPYVEIRFSQGGHETLDFVARKEVGVPAEGDAFASNLARFMTNAVRTHVASLRTISKDIHSRWDFGDATNLHIERLMDEAQRRTFSPRVAVLALDGEPAGQVRAGDDGLIKQKLYLGPGEQASGTLRPIRYDSVQTDIAMAARFCLQRQEQSAPEQDPARVGYDCPIDGDCASDIVTPEDWALTQCNRQGGLLDRLNLDLVASAYAVERTPLHWSVPPLSMLYRQSADARQANTGFTDFTIETSAPLPLEADAVALELSSNGVPIWLNSIPPVENRVPIDPEEGLLLRFGIQNLQLADRIDGCEELDARLVFYAGNNPTGNEISLKRLYAPLRHPADRVINTDFGPVSWTGRYRQPATERESGIFLASAKFHPNDPGARDAALEDLNGLRQQFEAVGLSISARELGGEVGLVGKPDIRANPDSTRLQLVGKIRPPRTVRPNGEISYGLQLGLRGPSGLLQYTYDREQTRKLLDVLLRARSQDPFLSNFLPARRDQFYVYAYTSKRNIGPEWACKLNR